MFDFTPCIIDKLNAMYGLFIFKCYISSFLLPPLPLTLTVYRGRDPSPHGTFRLLCEPQTRSENWARFQNAHFFRGRSSALLLMFKHHRLKPGNDWTITVIKERWPLVFSSLLQSLTSCRGLLFIEKMHKGGVPSISGLILVAVSERKRQQNLSW